MYNISFYKDENEEEWDRFIENSKNGLFLQTRRFINYHREGKFKDCSICIRKGNELVGVVLANELIEDGKKIFFSHKGTTFGGISISNQIYSATKIDALFYELISFLKDNDYKSIYIKMVPEIYQKSNSDLLDYFLYKYDFNCINELNYYMHLGRYKNDILSQFTSNKRRDYKYSLRDDLVFRELKSEEEYFEYYQILRMNLKKLNLPAVHSFEDIMDLKNNRFNDKLFLYGVYKDDKMIAGSLVFIFNSEVFHTQYLSSDENYLEYFPMEFLIYNLISESIQMNMKLFSFGICTENQGKYLNFNLSRFKEGFGAEFCINRSYRLDF